MAGPRVESFAAVAVCTLAWHLIERASSTRVFSNPAIPYWNALIRSRAMNSTIR